MPPEVRKHKRTKERDVSQDIGHHLIVNVPHLFLLLLVSDTFTDTAISSTRVNGEHKEKVLQRWEGGDSNGENYDLDNDAVSRPVSGCWV